MPGPFFFAWIGGVEDPAYSVTTTGDVWGGQKTTFGNVWGGQVSTTGDVLDGSSTVENLLDPRSLIAGDSYIVTGPGIPEGTTGTFDGISSLELSLFATETNPGATLVIRNDSLATTVSGVTDIDQLVIGRVYGIAGSGIQPETIFTFGGTDVFILSQAATATAASTSLTISSTLEADIVKNLGNVSGLVAGQTYSIFGPGIPASAIFTYAGGDDVTISQAAAATGAGVPITIRKGITEDDGGPFDPEVHNVYDEVVYSVAIDHNEGDFATAQVVVRNTAEGLGSPGRKQWAWVSWDPGDGTPRPLIHGRVVTIPRGLGGETITIELVARPADYFTQKSQLAAGMRDLPEWDPVFLAAGIADPDTVLEARTERWHIDRNTLEVTTSDILNPEDGTIEVGQGDIIYSSFDLSYSQPALTSVIIRATVPWVQEAEGEVDLTDALVVKFQEAGSPYSWPIIGSFTSDGLLSSWPAANTDIAGGWKVSPDAGIALADWVSTGNVIKHFSAPSATQPTQFDTPPPADPFGHPTGFSFGLPQQVQVVYANFTATFPITPLFVSFLAHYTAARNRSETLTFVLNADVQSVLVDPNSSDVEVLELSSEFVAKPVDEGGALPIEDLAKNLYFPTPRGEMSCRFLLLRARAILLDRARAAQVKFTLTSWAKALELSCRKAVLITDRRLPGGQALGKVVAYGLDMSGGRQVANVTIGCAVGLANTLPALPDPVDSYAVDYSVGYTAAEAGTEVIEVVAGELQYESLAGTYVVDDDGVDFYNMTPGAVLKSLTIINGPSAQHFLIDEAAKAHGSQIADPSGALKNAPTQIDVELASVAGGDFHTEYALNVANLFVPKMIDLGAPLP